MRLSGIHLHTAGCWMKEAAHVTEVNQHFPMGGKYGVLLTDAVLGKILP